ncbi:MAG: osmotically inducible protein OsmC [Stenotrophomonas acidaminiphila]|nr:MAG: osmotically inducible protein OsmC [Stenotrophomonas acidaminiphila]
MSASRVQVGVSETGDTPFSVRIDVGDHVLTGDEPVEIGGGGTGPSPYQLLAAALAECSVMTVRWFARQRGWPLEHVAVDVAWMRKIPSGAAKSADVFTKTVHLRGDALTAEQRRRLVEIAASCPVHRTLEGMPVIETIIDV